MILHSNEQPNPSVKVLLAQMLAPNIRSFVALKMLSSTNIPLGAISCAPSIQPDMRPVPAG
jgi:hypothetical protein